MSTFACFSEPNSLIEDNFVNQRDDKRFNKTNPGGGREKKNEALTSHKDSFVPFCCNVHSFEICHKNNFLL